ncbi:MAG: penicillin-binding protein 2 [Anaerolineales bacterium]
MSLPEHNPNLENTIDPWRIRVFAIVVVLIFSVFTLRLYTLQVLNGADYVARAADNRTREINIQAPRGIITDRNGAVLARNTAAYNVVILPADLPDDEADIQRIYRELSAVIGVPVNLNELSSENPYVPCRSAHGIAQIALYGITASPYTPVKIKCDVDEITARVVMERSVDWPGVSIEIEPIRDYPTGNLTANIVGYMGPVPAELLDYDLYQQQRLVANRDKVGYAGVELSLQDILGGTNGLRVVEQDVAGQILRDLQPPILPQPGKNVRLTIDVRLQQLARTLLVNEMDYLNRISPTGIRTTSGVVIAINPKTGEILAMVSYPSYDNNRMARFIPAYYLEQLQSDGREPLLNHAIQAERPPGSVFKLVTAVGALNEGVVTPDQLVKTPGVITLIQKYYANDPGKPQEFVDWIYQNGLHPEGFRQLTIRGCIQNSSNVCFYKLGGGFSDEIPNGGLNVCRLKTYAEALGYGFPSGIELPGEENGLLPSPSWKRITQGENWATGDTYIASVGQGYVLVTALQVLMSAVTIANDGVLMQPTIVHTIVDGEGNVITPFTPQKKWDITQDNLIKVYAPQAGVSSSCQETGETRNVDPAVLQVVQEGMRLAVTDGTLKETFEGFPIAAAGKTGTAEYCDDVAQKKGLCIPKRWPTHGWTVAYAPYDDPEIAVVAFLYNAGEGAKTAAPVVRGVIEGYFHLKTIDAGGETP